MQTSGLAAGTVRTCLPVYLLAGVRAFDDPVLVLPHEAALPEEVGGHHGFEHRDEGHAVHPGDQPCVVVEVGEVLHLQRPGFQRSFGCGAALLAAGAHHVGCDQAVHTAGADENFHIEDPGLRVERDPPSLLPDHLVHQLGTAADGVVADHQLIAVVDEAADRFLGGHDLPVCCGHAILPRFMV
jgi:hypothetical protein